MNKIVNKCLLLSGAIAVVFMIRVYIYNTNVYNPHTMSLLLFDEVEALSFTDGYGDDVQKYYYKNWHIVHQIENEDGEMIDTDSVRGVYKYRWCLDNEQVKFAKSQGYVDEDYHSHGPAICDVSLPLCQNN